MSKKRLCGCGCGEYFIKKTNLGNQKYILGHSPHGHYRKTMKIRYPVTRQGTKPEQCGKCGGQCLETLREAEGCYVMESWRCLNCGWVAF